MCFQCKRKKSSLASVAITNAGSGAEVKEKPMIRNVFNAGGARASISVDNSMWHGQSLKPLLL